MVVRSEQQIKWFVRAEDFRDVRVNRNDLKIKQTRVTTFDFVSDRLVIAFSVREN